MDHKKPDVSLPDYSETAFHLSAKGQTIDYWHALIKSLEGHAQTKGEKAVIYIVDTASEWTHDDIQPLGNQFGADFYNEDEPDGHGHGHLCAGVAGAMDNAQGVIGVAPAALLVPVRGLNRNGQGFTSNIVNAVRHCRETHAEHFPDELGIISMSFGGSGTMPTLEAELRRCVDAGMIPVAAAGNSGHPEGQDTVAYPGKYDELCITVAAIGPDNKPAWFTSAGEAVDMTAYGVNILSTNNLNGYSRVNGTSFSTPMVAGLIACIGTKHLQDFKAAGSGAKALMEAHLKKLAVDMLEAGEDNLTGAGRPELPTYLDTPPSDPGDPGDDNPNPPEPPSGPPTREERELLLKVPGMFRLLWATMAGSQAAQHAETLYSNDLLAVDNVAALFEVTSLQNLNWQSFYITDVEIGLTTNLYEDYITEHFQDFVNRHWPDGRRGYLLAAGKDVKDAGDAALHFLQMFAKRENWTISYSLCAAGQAQAETIRYQCTKTQF